MTTVKKIDFDSPIIPGQGIGEIKLLENAFSLRQLILSNTLSGQNIDWIFTTEKQFPDWLTLNYRDIFLVGVNIYTGKITSLTVRQGFKGKIFQQISIGSYVKDLFKLDNDFYYDESDEYILHKTNFDIRFDIDLKNRISFTDNEVEESRITEITILNHEQSSTIIGATEFPKEWTK
ncbi:MAG TPA: hypothetical protein VK177_21580 [Flavobacteriales bacterium]|nr:hypothetical protein [Flavobacteriales bacterium]